MEIHDGCRCIFDDKVPGTRKHYCGRFGSPLPPGTVTDHTIVLLVLVVMVIVGWWITTPAVVR